MRKYFLYILIQAKFNLLVGYFEYLTYLIYIWFFYACLVDSEIFPSTSVDLKLIWILYLGTEGYGWVV